MQGAATSLSLLLSCVLDKHDITVLATSTEDQLFAIRRPVETDQRDSVKMCNLIQRAIAYSEAPDVVAILTGNVLKDPNYIHEYHTRVLKTPNGALIQSTFGNPPTVLPPDNNLIAKFINR